MNKKRKLNEKGLDDMGFDKKGIHYITGGRYDLEGYNVHGYNRKGFNRQGIHKITKCEYDEEGYNQYGYNKDGFDRAGFNREKIHRDTLTIYDKEGYDIDGYNEKGFNRSGKHIITRTKYDPDGYDQFGYNKKGYNRGGFDKHGYDIDGYDSDGYNKEGFNKEKIHRDTQTLYNPEGFNIEGFNEAGYNREGYDHYNISKDGINKETGKKDPRVEFAEEFLKHGKSIRSFAKSIRMSEEKVRNRIEEIRECPFIRDKIDKLLERNASTYIAIVLSNKEKLLSGKINLEDVTYLQDIFMKCDKDEKIKLLNIVVPKFASHQIGILDYAKIFSLEVDSGLPERIGIQIKQMIKDVNNSGGDLRKKSGDLYAECSRIDTYKRPFHRGDISQMGYQGKMVTITDEHIALARNYLKVTNEFFCSKTVLDTLGKIIKGEITPETIERIKKEKELRGLQRKDEQLGEMIDGVNKIMGAKSSDVLTRTQGDDSN